MSRSDHVQGTLLPPEAIVATLRLGIVGAADVVQAQVEVRNASDDTLLAMESLPFARLEFLEDIAATWTRRLLAATKSHVLPF